MPLQCVRLSHHVNLNFRNLMSTATVFFDVEKAFDTTLHTGLLYKVSELHLSSSLIKLAHSFPTENTQLWLRANCPRLEIHNQGCRKIPSCPLHCSQYKNYTPQIPGVYLALIADDTCVYTTDRKEGYVLRKLQRDLTSMESWCELWNIKITEDKTWAIYFFHHPRPVDAYLTLK
jgi:hypothetical protein